MLSACLTDNCCGVCIASGPAVNADAGAIHLVSFTVCAITALYGVVDMETPCNRSRDPVHSDASPKGVD